MFAEERQVGPSPEEAFRSPNLHTPKQLYDLSRKALASGRLDEARLFAMRLFFDGNRSKNLLNLLGVIEVQAKQPLIASEWFRRSLNLSLNNKVARKYLSRLPAHPRPIPVEPTKLADHFTVISEKIPEILKRLVSPKLHFGSIMTSLARGQIYLALALSEEYEKKYPGPDGAGLTALCAWYLGRNRDALQLAEQGLEKAPFHPLLLFVKAMITDTHVGSSSTSYFRALYDLDKWKKALGLVDRFSKAFPESPDGYIIKSRIMLDIHQIKEAGIALQEAGKRDPGNPEIDLLWIEYLLQRNQPEKASKRLNNAYKRGYNMPSVNLTAGLFALQAGRINEVNLILNESLNNRPFTDPEAYPIYISLLLMTDKIIEARSAMDEWKKRVQEKSMVCYLEALYSFKTGDNRGAISWLNKGFKQNPNRLGILQFLSGFPAITDDPHLAALINNRLAKAGIKGYTARTVPEKKNVQSAQANSNVAGSTDTPQANPESIFQIKLAPNIDESARNLLFAELSKLYKKAAAFLGTVSGPVFINLVSAEGMGPTIALYEPQNKSITVTSNYFDSEVLRSIILTGFEAIGEDEVGALIEDYPAQVLGRELIQLIIQAIIPKARENPEKSAWLQMGLAELVAGRSSAIRYRLLIANKSISDKLAKFTSEKMMNSIFAEGYSSPAVLDTAIAQAYLMTAFLVKKAGSLDKGCRAVMKMIEQVSAGVTFADSLKGIFGLTETEFEQGWKDAAYWALKQGAAYQW